VSGGVPDRSSAGGRPSPDRAPYGGLGPTVDGEPGPIFFAGPAAFRAWLAEHHGTESVLWVGFWKKATGKPSLTWTESVEAALSYGWIDGLRKSIDEEAYRIRFTPRRPGSHWSRKNVASYRKLEAEGRIEAAGRAAWEARNPENTARASYERERAELSEDFRARLDANADAAAWFAAQPSGYRRTVTHWVMSAKRPETRERRMDQLIEDSAAGLRIKPLRR
jgi:uncharacterized protein YdeI (YjbR/CyaY-like superfamily)